MAQAAQQQATQAINPKQLKLVKLANARVPRAVRAINLIGQLGKYNPTPAQIQKIVDTLQESFTALILNLKPKEEKEEPKNNFKL
jgi:hypothetical protein